MLLYVEQYTFLDLNNIRTYVYIYGTFLDKDKVDEENIFICKSGPLKLL